MEIRYRASNLEETHKLAEAIGSKVSAGDVILLDGDLGAGKTTWTQVLAKTIGVTDVVNSPTFSLVNEYQSDKGIFYHFDLYRIDFPQELFDIGFEEYGMQNGIMVIEWAHKFIELMPEPYLAIYIKRLSDTEREFVFSGDSLDKFEAVIKELG